MDIFNPLLDFDFHPNENSILRIKKNEPMQQNRDWIR